MSRTISTSTKYGVLLHGTDSPVTVAPGATIDSSGTSKYGLYSTSPMPISIENLGAVEGRAAGISLAHAHKITNGSLSDTSASVSGTAGIEVFGPGVVVQNFAAIEGDVAVYLVHGGRVENGSAGDGSAFIYGTDFGVLLGRSGSVANNAAIEAYGGVGGSPGIGVHLEAGGTISNGLANASALIDGFYGYGVVIGGGPGRVTNGGTIAGGAGYRYPPSTPGHYLWGTAVLLSAGGTVANGVSGHAAAEIAGGFVGIEITGGSAKVVNDGIIRGVTHQSYYSGPADVDATFGTGVTLAAGGEVVNGAIAAPGAVIAGGRYGVAISGHSGTVRNEATIASGGRLDSGGMGGNATYYFGSAVTLAAGGTVVNGSSTLATGALVTSENVGIAISGAAALVANFGTITAANTTSSFAYYQYEFGTGIALQAGGHVVNGSTAVTNALIAGSAVGVRIAGGFGTVGNDGTIVAAASSVSGVFQDFSGGVGVHATAGAKINNGVFGVGSALISGYADGVLVSGGPGLVLNAGTIAGDGTGVALYGGNGTVINSGTITGYNGVVIGYNGIVSGGAANVTNSGVIAGGGRGVYLFGGAETIVNSGTIMGYVAIDVRGTSAAVTNTGTIIGNSEFLALLNANSNTLAIGAGAVFEGGAVQADVSSQNTLQLLAGAPGTVAGIGTTFGHQFIGFQTLAVEDGASWSLAGVNPAGTDFGVQLGAGASLDVTGALDIGSVLTLHGPGALGVGSAGELVVGAGQGAANGQVTVDGGTIIGSGTIATKVADNGHVVASGGTLVLGTDVEGTGTVAIGAHAVLEAMGSLAAAHVQFLFGTAETLALADPKMMSSEIAGFARGCRIDLLGTVATGLSFSSATDILTVRGAGGAIAALQFSSSYGAERFVLAPDGHGGSNIMLN